MFDGTNSNTALASAFVEELARSGLRQAIVSPGSRSTPLAVALWRQPGIEVTVVIDERSAAFMALGAAKVSGRPVALLSTSGTAAANHHPAVAEADLSAVPMVVLTADRPPELRENGSGQTIDQIKLFGGAVRWFSEVGSHTADDVGLLHFRSLACRAFAAASGDPRPGPVHLNFPFREPLAPVPDPGAVTARSRLALKGRVGRQETVPAAAGTRPRSTPRGPTGRPGHPGDPDARPLVRIEPPRPRLPDRATLDHLAERLAGAERVLVLAGRQTDPGLRGTISRLAGALDCPVLAEPTSQLLCGPHDRSRVIPGYARIGASPEYGVSGFTNHPELLPQVVLRFGEMPTSKGLRLWLSGLEEVEQIVIDPDHGFNEPTGRAELILRADPGALANALAERISAVRPAADSYLKAWRAAIASLPEPERSSTGPLYRALAEAMPEGGVLYVNSSMPIRDLESFTPSLPTDLTLLANRGANGIDGLIASGLGAALGGDRPTVIVTGDVGFLHDLGSLANWKKLENRPHILVIDNRGGAIFDRLPQKQVLPPDEFEGLMSTTPDLDIPAAAALFGLPCHRLDDPTDLRRLLTGEPALIQVRTGRVRPSA